MTSIFRKLTTRRKKTKPTTAASGNSTESSHASELDSKGLKQPQHLEPKKPSSKKDVLSVQREETATPQRSRSRSKDRSGDNGQGPAASSGDRDNWSVNVPSASRDGKVNRRFFFQKPGSNPSIKASVPPMYDSEDETAATSTATATGALKRGRKPRTKENHEVIAPPGAHGGPKKHMFQQARQKSTRQTSSANIQSKESFDEAVAISNGEKPQESSLVPQSSTKQIAATGKSVSNLSAEEVARQQAVNKEADRIAKAAAALDNRGNEYFERGYYDKAMDAYTRALKLKRRTFHSMLEEADDLFDETDDKETLDSNERDLDPKLLVSMATSINNIGYLRQRAGEATPDETMAAYKKSLRIKRKILGNDSLSVGKTLNNIGSVYYLKKEFDGALPAYEEALLIMQSNLGEEHPDVATVISNMGDVLLAMQKQDESLARYRTALNIRWNSFGEKDPRTMRLLEKIARIEIGDKMPTPRGTRMERQVYDWDESELYDLDLRPISHELRLLKDQLKEDLETVELLEKKIAVGMVRDKIKIVRGMRELMEAQERENESFSRFDGSFNFDSSTKEDSTREIDDDIISPVLATASSESSRKDEAKARVRERIAKLRIAKGLDAPGLDSTKDSIPTPLNGSTHNQSFGPSELLRSTLLATGGHNPRKPLSSMKPDEIRDQADDVESALKLKKGIDNLRTLGGAQQGVPDKPPVLVAAQVKSENSAVNSVTSAASGDQAADLKDAIEKHVVNRLEGPVQAYDSNDDAGDHPVEGDGAEGELQAGKDAAAARKIMYTTWLGEIKD